MPDNRDDAGKPLPPVENRFKPGQSGNPGGRPKALQEITKLAREHTAFAIERLVALATGRGMPAVKACEVLLDRAWGKAPQALTDADGEPIRLGLIVLPGEKVDGR